MFNKFFNFNPKPKSEIENNENKPSTDEKDEFLEGLLKQVDNFDSKSYYDKRRPFYSKGKDNPSENVTEEQLRKYLHNKEIPNGLLEKIAQKILSGEYLSDRENIIFCNEETEINKIKVGMTEKSKINKIGQSLLNRKVKQQKIPQILDLLKHLLSVGAEVDDNGNVALYHGTSGEIHNIIKNTGKMVSKYANGGIFFSTSPLLDSKGFAELKSKENPVVAKFMIPIEKLEIDERGTKNSDELHVKIPTKKESEIVDIKKYIQS